MTIFEMRDIAPPSADAAPGPPAPWGPGIRTALRAAELAGRSGAAFPSRGPDTEDMNSQVAFAAAGDRVTLVSGGLWVGAGEPEAGAQREGGWLGAGQGDHVAVGLRGPQLFRPSVHPPVRAPTCATTAQSGGRV